MQPYYPRTPGRASVDETQIREPERVERVPEHVQSTRPERLVRLPLRNQILDRRIYLLHARLVAAGDEAEELVEQRHGGGAVARSGVEAEEHGEAVVADAIHGGVEYVDVGGVIAPRVLLVHLVLEEHVEGIVAVGLALDDVSRWSEIEGVDLDGGSGRGEEVESVVGGIEMDLGAENRVGILEFVEGILDNSDLRRFWEEEAQNRYASADGNSLAPAELGAADGPGLGGWWALGLSVAVLGHIVGWEWVNESEKRVVKWRSREG